jgi:hypothetical protein
VTNLDTVPILNDRRGGGAQVLGGVRISGWGARFLFSVVLRDGLKVLESLALGEDAELEFVACYVEEGVFWAEDLAEEGVIKSVEPCPGNAYEGEFYREKGDGDLHISGGGTGRGVMQVQDGWRSMYLFRGGANLEYLGLARDMPSYHHLNRYCAKLNVTLTQMTPVPIHPLTQNTDTYKVQ